jgi:hypothetical protein
MMWDQSEDSLCLTDSTCLNIGDGDDLKIYHDGTNSKILNTAGYLQVGTSSGILYLDGNTTCIRSGDGGEVQANIYAANDGAVELIPQ